MGEDGFIDFNVFVYFYNLLKKDVWILVVINECRKFLFLNIELECKY